MRSKLIELFTRVIPINKQTNVYNNGQDNNYPERIERIVNNSVTAKMSAEKLGDYIFGLGFDEYSETIINKSKNYTFNDILSLIKNNIKYHKAFYLHINYGADNKPNFLDVLPYKNTRISKNDVLGYKRPIFYSEDWHKKEFIFSFKKENKKWFYPFNSDPKIILAQREKDAEKYLSSEDTDQERIIKLVENYRGQVLFCSLEPENIYPLSYIDPAYNDADSEFRASVFKNTNLRSGFLGKMIATILKPTDKKEQEIIYKDLADLLGAENTGNLMVFEGELNEKGELPSMVKFEPVKSNYDDKLVKYTEESVCENIMMSYKIHPALVKPSNQMFGTSGETYINIQNAFQKETSKERMLIESAFKLIFKKDFKIIPLIEND